MLVHTNRRTLLRDTQGLATAEYVVLLTTLVVMTAPLWRRFGLRLVELIRAANDALVAL